MTTQEELYEKYLLKKANKRYSVGKQYFTVFRVGDKFKNNTEADNITIDGLAKFDRHSNRKSKVINADPEKKSLNRIIIGSENVTEDVMMYLEGVKIRKDSVIARELILSAGNGFWNRLSDYDRERWIEANYKFLKQYFGDNCVYAVLHMDETTPHFHALIVPVMTNKRGLPHLNNSFYFGDKDKLSAWQDRYTEAMSKDFQNIFKRGIRGSKATHVDLKTYYSLVKENLDELNNDVVLANAKENFINKKKIEELQDTLEDKEEQLRLIKEIVKKNKELKEDKKLYEYIIRNLSDKYNIPEKEVYKIIKSKIKDKGIERER